MLQLQHPLASLEQISQYRGRVQQALDNLEQQPAQAPTLVSRPLQAGIGRHWGLAIGHGVVDFTVPPDASTIGWQTGSVSASAASALSSSLMELGLQASASQALKEYQLTANQVLRAAGLARQVLAAKDIGASTAMLGDACTPDLPSLTKAANLNSAMDKLMRSAFKHLWGDMQSRYRSTSSFNICLVGRVCVEGRSFVSQGEPPCSAVGGCSMGSLAAGSDRDA